jgi:hypothetical protein
MATWVGSKAAVDGATGLDGGTTDGEGLPPPAAVLADPLARGEAGIAEGVTFG